MKSGIAEYQLHELLEGQEYAFEETITAAMVDDFAAVSGDASCLHMNDEFARSRRFTGRVVHGALLAGLLSRLVGMHLPGKNALLQSMNMNFKQPAYIGDTVTVTAIVDQISTAANVIVLKASIVNTLTGQTLAKGKVQVGFTNAG